MRGESEWVKIQITGVRFQVSDGRCQKPDDRCRRTEDRCRMSENFEVGVWNAEVGKERTEQKEVGPAAFPEKWIIGAASIRKAEVGKMVQRAKSREQRAWGRAQRTEG